MSDQTNNPKAHVVELIRTELQLRGKGVGGDPARVVEQFWTTSGKLAAENDPFHPNQTSCLAVVEMLKSRGFDEVTDFTELPAAVAAALDSLQNVIDKQKDSIAKLQDKVQECQAEPTKTKPQRKKTT